MPVESALRHISKIWILDSAVKSLCHGAPLHLPGVCKFESSIIADKPVAILTLKGELICIAKAVMNSEQIKANARGLVAVSLAVFTKPAI